MGTASTRHVNVWRRAVSIQLRRRRLVAASRRRRLLGTGTSTFGVARRIVTQLLEHLHAILNQWEQYSDTLDIQQVRRYCPPLVPLSSGHGRPRFDISQEQLQYLRSLSFTWTDIADMLMVSRMTVYRRRVQYGLLSDPQSSISDQQLIERVRQLLVQHPHVGQSFISGQLMSQGYRVSRERICHAVRACDPLDAALRWQGIATRRHPYSVPGPNSLWHIGNFHHSYIGRSRQCKINA